jgi:hypothetical protein
VTITFEDASPLDTIPFDLSDVEYPCTECGREAGPYAGKGRKPTKCPDHKPGKGTRSPKVGGTNARLAEQATEALAQINNFMALGCMLGQFHATAGRIAEYDPTFRAQTYNALLTDPDLCRYILKAGTKSGKLALGVSYAMFAAAIMPTALAELKEKRAAKAAALEAEDIG